MTIYKRGSIWWYQFLFKGQIVRETSKSTSKTVAREAEKQRRRELELAYNSIPEKKAAPLFKNAARDWLDSKGSKAAKTISGYQQRMKPVTAAFGQRLVCDIDADDVLTYRSQRVKQGASNRTVNYEVGCLRGVLKRHRFWLPIAQEFAARDLKIKLDENHDVGQALSVEHEEKLLAACRQSAAPSLLPLFIFARDTGLRAAEIKALRYRDLRLEWKDGVLIAGEVIVPKSKTAAGKGRSVSLSLDVCSTLTMWLSRFPGAGPDSFVFPSHEVQQVKGSTESKIVDADLNQPVQSWQTAWRTALDAAGVHYRWHDLRHTFISRLAENPHVSEQTILALAGHVSKRMMDRYSHIRRDAKEQAIAALHSQRTKNSGRVGTKSYTVRGASRQGARATH